MDCIQRSVICDKTLQLIRKSLTAGYVDPENNNVVVNDKGTPQGSVFSPLLANIVLHELDSKMEDIRKNFEKGLKRARNKEYDKLTSKIQSLQKYSPGSPEIKELAIERRKLTSSDPFDPNFKRLMYLRYADDFVVLITGSINDAKHIKHRITDILHKNCGLDLNHEKTIITATEDGFMFLGAKCIKVSAAAAGLSRSNLNNPAKYRMRMRIEIPIINLLERLKSNKFVKMNKLGLPTATARKDLVNFSHYEILTFYNNRINGLLNFYSLAVNLTSLRKIIMFLQLSCSLTLALKLKLRTKRQAFKLFGPLLKDPETDLILKIPKTLKVKHDYKNDRAQTPDTTLRQS